MNFIFLMDPLDTVVMDNDTTFILMLGAHRKGHKIFYLPDGGMTLRYGQLFFDTISVVPQQNKERPFIQGEEIILQEDEINAIFIRNDPPFDQQYLMNTWLLDKLMRRIPVINSPNGIRTVNEKIWVTQFTSIIPSTMISRQKDDLWDFIKSHHHVVAKPTDGFGGQSVFQIQHNDTNTQVILETLTAYWSREIILQKYIPQAQHGDKRILLLDGEPLGAVLRVHSSHDHRNNLFAGGKSHPAEITNRDREIIDEIKPQLQRLGLYFVGIDIIGDYLIEVNVTSPTCLQEMNYLYHKQLDDDVIEFVERLIEG